ncbi:FAD-dependent oxidoreductase [Lutimonas halocynthiae]|uniref:FAD-dependent oxidoreductase n=1 Tax=Lutimonas halocynthiae TaxID=1446477 RepID=UPI0025B61735|nr:FAD-dependent oxidoreductase [Lutimonas halocynthiae]MDN3641651.1 FAD-dependent oxidoreductase [Lutimonas halocynthiae]
MTKKKEILIIGAGPSGLSAALELAKTGHKIILIEKAKCPGGLMRNINHGDFNVDLGRKELYTRIQKVNDFWEELLHDDYIKYEHRVGILYKNKILESSILYKGRLKGLSLIQFLKCLISFVKEKISNRKVSNYRDFAYKNSGVLFTEIFTKGFHEKFVGRLWKDLPIPDKTAREIDNRSTVSLFQYFFLKKFETKASRIEWRHPKYGAGQITNLIIEKLNNLNVNVHYESNLSGVKIIDNSISLVTIELKGVKKELKPDYVISSIPPEFSGNIFLNLDYAKTQVKTSMNRGAILVYLFLDESSKFNHCWVNVSDQNSKIGRIVNYSNFGGGMVPKFKTCLCLEYFLFNKDPLFDLPKQELLEMALTELTKAHLINRENLQYHMIFKLPNTNPAVDWKDYLNEPHKVELYKKLKEIKNLYNVNRAGTDRATHAGLEAAAAIKFGSKELFEKYTDPRQKEPWNH